MNSIHLVRVGLEAAGGAPPLELLDRLSAGLARVFRTNCRVREEIVDATPAFAEQRGQYHSTMLLQSLAAMAPGDGTRLLGVASVDLFVPVLTFVFGEAQLAGPAALVSLRRLDEVHYGLPHNRALLDRRLLIEAVHELGHTFGLRHCREWQCAMSSSHAVERIDLKQPSFCKACGAAVA